jgi:hypothetical protein
MGLFAVVILIGVGVCVAAALLGLFSAMTYSRVAAIGFALGLLFWGVMAIVIFRGPENPELGEAGWTLVVGLYVGLYVLAWLVGAAVGRALRGLRSRRTADFA